jgi:hypothetical protein
MIVKSFQLLCHDRLYERGHDVDFPGRRVSHLRLKQTSRKSGCFVARTGLKKDYAEELDPGQCCRRQVIENNQNRQVSSRIGSHSF